MIPALPRRPPPSRRALAALFRLDPFRSLGRSLYGAADRYVARDLARLPGILDVRSLAESPATRIPVVSDLDLLVRIDERNLEATVAASRDRFRRLKRFIPMLGDVAGVSTRLEDLIRRTRSSALFFLEWPEAPALGLGPRLGLGLELYRQAWSRWLLGVSGQDSLFHARAIRRALKKASIVLSADPRRCDDLSPDEGLALLCRRLNEASQRGEETTGRLPGGLVAPPASPCLARNWRVQWEWWNGRVSAFSSDAIGSVPGVAITDAGVEVEFWRRLRRKFAAEPESSIRLAPLPLPRAVVSWYLAGWTGWHVPGYRLTKENAAAYRVESPLGESWSQQAAASIRDRLISRLVFVLGRLLRGSPLGPGDLVAENWAMQALSSGEFPEEPLKPEAEAGFDPIRWFETRLLRLEAT